MKKMVLMILDGYGYSEEIKGNAIKQANTPTLDYLFKTYPNCFLKASGLDVGLPNKQMGNSEVGHLNIGAGRIVEQHLVRINNLIENKKFYKNKEFLNAIKNCKKNNTNLHLIGMVSDGGIHSHIDHLFALLKLCKKEQFDRVFIHVLLDGRDTGALDNEKYVDQLQSVINELKIGKIATIMGRYYAMNRDKNYELIKLAYNAIVDGKGEYYVKDYKEAFIKEHEEKVTDEFMKPTIIMNEEKPLSIISKNDSVICFNYRSDRMLQLTNCFNDKNYDKFERRYVNTYYVCMTDYNVNFDNIHIAFENHDLKNTLGEVISNKKLKQIRITENEKFAHVTYYFNGEKSLPFKNEERILIPRKKVFTYDEYPPMSSKEITDTVLNSIEKDYSLIVINFANCDALGHTGNIKACIESIEYLDKCIEKIYNKCKKENIGLMITADHGNAEHMIKENGEVDKSHTCNLVRFVLCDDSLKLNDGKLSDIAPTILEQLNIKKPKEMTGRSLIK